MSARREELTSQAAPHSLSASPVQAGWSKALAALRGDTLLRRLLLLYATAVTAIILVGAAVIWFAVWPHYEGLERREASHRENAVLQAIQSERDRLKDLTNTYGVWDAPFDYVVGSEPTFPEANLYPSALDQIEVDGVFIANNEGAILFQGAGTDGAQWPDLLPAVERAFREAPGLRLGPDDSGRTAIVAVADVAAIVSVRRITHTDGSGPSPGVIVFARIVGPAMLTRMSALTGTAFQIEVMQPGEGPPGRLHPEESSHAVRSQAWLQDANNVETIRVNVFGAPEVLNLGRATITTLVVTMLAALVAMAGGFAMALIGAVVTPVTALMQNIDAASRGLPPSAKLRRPPAEIEQLSAAFDAAFDRIRQEAALHRAAHQDAINAYAAAEQANRAKSLFLASMSHELRTPLNAVIGYSEMMQESAADDGRAEDTEDHERILVAAKGLLTMINSILDFSRLESGQMPIFAEKFDVLDVTKSVTDVVRPAISAKGLKFNVVIDRNIGVATSDPTRIRQCLTNLLANAAKFTTAGEITFRAARRTVDGQDSLLFAIEDTGIGMTEDQLKRVFEPFVQADDSISRRFGGTGLGLSITRDLVTRMGGRIGVKSALGLGTRFVVRIPATMPAELDSRTQAAAARPAA